MSQVLPSEVSEFELKMSYYSHLCAYNFATGFLKSSNILRIAAGFRFAMYYCIILRDALMAKSIYKKVIDAAKNTTTNDNPDEVIAKCKFEFFDELQFYCEESMSEVYKFFNDDLTHHTLHLKCLTVPD
ncbi:hypothetical protein FQR65_LT00979 [Abscondita terminalis]|nr:hypothetical protein FQR65_LT00979 [Abscondita terminalis]